MSRYLLTVTLLALTTPASSQAVTKLQVTTSGWQQARVSLVRLDTSDEVDSRLNGAEYVIETNGPPDAQTLRGKLIVQDDQQEGESEDQKAIAPSCATCLLDDG